MLDRQVMDESPNEKTGEGQPTEGEGAGLSTEEGGILSPGAVLDATGSLTGATIGHYLVGERLGGGAMAVVYRAHDQILDTNVAIKVLLPGADSVMQARFRREARMVSNLVHPHIVRTLQVGRSGGIIYIAMELIEGTSLGELLERQGTLVVGDAARILAPVAEALAYAHHKGIIHRDVKPSNILLKRATQDTQNSVVVGALPYAVIPLLSDFGIARALDAPELTNAGRTIGTPAFMAPEQCAGSAEIDGRADVYALGAVLYRCLVGRPPYGGTTTQILHAHVYDPLLIPDEVASALPAPVVRIMARSMMKEPSQRFERVDLMAKELHFVAETNLPTMQGQETEPADSTMTMASLPVAQLPATGTSRVLVAAAPIAAPRTSPLKPAPRTGVPGTSSARAVPKAPSSAAHKRSRTSQLGVIALIAVPALLVLLLVGMLINSVLPGIGNDDPIGGDATATQQAVVAMSTPEQIATSGAGTPEGAGTPSEPNTRPTVVPTNTVVNGTPTPLPTPAVELAFAWEQVQDFYPKGEWEDAVTWLNFVDRILSGPPSPVANELGIEKRRVQQMLVTSYVGLAMDAASAGRWEDALGFFDDAIEHGPNDRLVTSMRESIRGYAELVDSTEESSEDKRKALREDLADIFDNYSISLQEQGFICDALFQVDHAIAMSESEERTERRAKLGEECETEKASDVVLALGGNILYSTVREDRNDLYDIWRLPLTLDNLSDQQSALVLENGSQPQLSPDSGALAYHNSQQGGLWGIGISSDLRTYGSATRYSANVEDGRDAPASWNPYNFMVAYSTRQGNQPSRVFLTSPDADTSAQNLTEGKDPAWSPNGDMIVFNGYDEGGSTPGLWLIRANGTARTRLTSNGNDQRPAWSSDGENIVFMSKDRPNDNWELYRLSLNNPGEPIQLTDGNAAQDGLPAISPDGKWVAFMSDRGGRWRLWYVSIDGGEVQYLSDINGQPIQWLEHSVQWVN